MQNGIYWIGSCESNINYRYKGKKKINIVLKSETTQLFWDTYFFANDSVIIERREYIELNWIELCPKFIGWNATLTEYLEALWVFLQKEAFLIVSLEFFISSFSAN